MQSHPQCPVRRGIPIEEYRRPETYPKSNENESGDTDFVAMAKDV